MGPKILAIQDQEQTQAKNKSRATHATPDLLEQQESHHIVSNHYNDLLY
jgi:hypothetical protein